MQRQRVSARRAAVFPAGGASPWLAALALASLLASPLLTAPSLAAAEWSRSVTVNQDVLNSLPAAGPVPALPVRRGPTPGAAAVEYRWDLLADLGHGKASSGGGGPAAWAQGYSKAPPALIRPGESPQGILGTGTR